jgi:hypothetical protein
MSNCKYMPSSVNVANLPVDTNSELKISIPKGVIVGVELTRPADTNAYVVNDVVSDSTSAPNVLTFANIARTEGGSGYIIKARMLTDQKTNVAAFRLHLYHTAPTAQNDNAAFALLFANKASRIGIIDFDPMGTEDATTSDSAQTLWTSGHLHFVLPAGSKTIYGQFETKTAFTPASGQKFYIELATDNN